MEERFDYDGLLEVNAALREQNRVLREVLEQAALTICSEFCGSEHHHRECEIVQAALTATSQPGGTHEL